MNDATRGPRDSRAAASEHRRDESRSLPVPVPDEVLAPFLRARGRVLLLGHVHPDADVLGTLLALGLALEARGWRATLGGPHPAPAVLSFLPEVGRYETLSTIEGRFDVVVLTDCPNPGRTEGLIDLARAAATTIVNIDHHPDNRRYGDVNWVEPVAAATAELVYALLLRLDAPITPAIATNLFTAIHTDTGSFRYSNVTPATFSIAAELVAMGAEPALVSNALYERRAATALRSLGDVLRRVEVSDDGQLAWLVLTEGTVPEAFVDAEDLVNYPRSIESVRVACLIRERGEQVKVSFRGKGDVDVSRIAHRFGGGGHPNAAGCSVPGTLETVTTEVLAAATAAIRDAADATRRG